MRRLKVFNQLSLDGFFADANNDMSWAHKQDDEWNAFAADNAKGGGALMFGRVTFEMMRNFWPTPAGEATNPAVAERMSRCEKIVFSRTLKDPEWENTTVYSRDLVGEVKRIKSQDGVDIVILGSGSLVAQLTDARLIDEYQVVTNPLVLGAGRSMFHGIRDRVPLALTRSRTFHNGNVVSWYRPL